MAPLRTRALLLVVLVACASPERRAAATWLREGRVLEAAGVWLSAVEADVDDPITKRHLEEVVPSAWEGGLDIARDHLVAGNPELAVDAYRALLAFHDRLIAVGVATPDVDDLRAELTTAEDAVALARYDTGVAAAGEGRWADAIGSYEAARALRPGYKDTTARMAEALRAQAAADLEGKRFRTALAAFDHAFALAGDDESEAWAAAIRVALGRKDLADGRCRAAFEGLAAAKGHIADAGLAADIESARRCARRELVVAPAEEATGTPLPGVAIGAVFADHATLALRAKGSEHLRLVDGSAPPPAREDGKRLSIKARITEMRAQTTDATVDRRAPGRTFVVCGGEEADIFQEGVGFLCEASVTVAWTEHVHTRSAHVSGTARIYDPAGVELSAVPFAGEEVSDARWAETFTVDGVAVRIAGDPAVGVVAIIGDAPAATAPPADVASDTDRLLAAARRAADNLATGVLEAVDRPETAPEPAWLNVVPPSLSPGDFEFKTVDPAEKAEPI